MRIVLESAVRRLAASTILVVGCCLVVVGGCGGDRGAVGEVDGGVGGLDARVIIDGEIPPPPPPPPMTAECGSALTVGHRLVTLGTDAGLLQPSTRRVLSFPDRLTASLTAMPVLQLAQDVDAGEDSEPPSVTSVAVIGEVPDGRVYAAAYQETLDRFIVLTWTRHPEPHYALTAVELTDTEARFTAYTLVNAIASDGFQVQRMHAIAGPRVAMLRGIDTLYHVTFDGETATFSDPIPVSTSWLPSTMVLDPETDRLIGYGTTFDPDMPHEDAFVPRISTLSLQTGGDWVELSTSGEAPEPLYGMDAHLLYQPFTAYDPTTHRLSVVHVRIEEDPIFPDMPYPVSVLYALDVATGAWTLAVDRPDVSWSTSGTPWLFDPEVHTSISLVGGSLQSLHLDGDMDGRITEERVDGTFTPDYDTPATALPDGRIVAVDRSGALMALSTSSLPTWTAFGDAVIPPNHREYGHLVYDTVNGSLLLLASSARADDPDAQTMHRIGLDGESIEPITSAVSPPLRASASVAVASGKVYLAGGFMPASSVALDDVWELDLATMVWRPLATLSVGRAGMGAMIHEGELWLIGGRADGTGELLGTPRVDAVDLASGAVHEVAVSGAWPALQGLFYGDAPLGDGYFTFDIGDDTIDDNAAALWLLEPDDAGGAVWTAEGTCLSDALVASGHGVSVGGTQVWTIGAHVVSVGL